MTDNAVNDATKPQGTLALQTFSMPKDTNANGDIFGGWLVSQMDHFNGCQTRQPQYFSTHYPIQTKK